MNALEMTIVSVAAALGVGAFGSRRAMQGSQKLRLLLAEKGEQLLGREDLNPVIRAEIGRRLDDAFPHSFRFFVVVTVIAPIVVPWAWRLARSRHKVYRDMPDDLRGQYLEVRQLHSRLQISNNPILFPLLQMELSILMALLGLVKNLMHGKVEVPPDRDTVLLEVEANDRWPGNRSTAIVGL